MKQIIVTKPNSLSAEDKASLKENDIILIEHENPSEVRVINQIEGFEGDDLFDSLVETIKSGLDSTKSSFASRLLSKIIDKKQSK